ncbi:thiamine diphosphokinase [Dictyobacter arantiisoli]|uniref:Thiamine diphosphokinase n=1 Tax=Dictyobacter arantiisoli TaxID=2014874 RepID=A0A5A5TEG9_9CHLR|nr:thiamine diphosphokinase [Dictyobacter arantiisoli]GCF09638.1 thiamine pyrophosphokinase [Dictyobacter arantiisoli]
MHVVVFAGGTLRPGTAVAEALSTADLVLAADGGAAAALQYGYRPAVVLGDFDSLDPLLLEDLAIHGSDIIRLSPHKDETDTELALLEAHKRGATRITLLGALGGTRIEHTLANIFLLTSFSDIPTRIIDGPSICWLLTGPDTTAITGSAGDYLSLIPLTPTVTGIHTTDLAYPLHGATLRLGTPRGVSNELIRAEATVSIDQGMLLLISTRRQEVE